MRILTDQAVTKPPRRLYRFLNDEFGFEALQNQHFKVTRISELNDPFELSGIHVLTPKYRDLPTLMKKGYFNEKTGMLCYSASWKNLVMWAHYANGHKGLCLGFDTSVLPPGSVQKVNYAQSMPSDDDYFARRKETPNNVSKKEQDKFKKKFLFTKSSHWKYEIEWRILINGNLKKDKIHYMNFSELGRLREVIIGMNSSLSINEIKKETDKMPHQIDVFTAEKRTGQFALNKHKET